MNLQSRGVLYKLMVYFVMTIVISWGAVYLVFGSAAIPATSDNQESVGMVILFGPLLSGLFLTFLYYRKNGAKRLLKKLASVKHPLKWYLFAILVAPISTFIVIFLSSFFISDVSPNFLEVEDLSSALILGFVGGLSVALFEEMGWTGFAVPAMLRKYNVFSTGLFLSKIWY